MLLCGLAPRRCTPRRCGNKSNRPRGGLRAARHFISQRVRNSEMMLGVVIISDSDRGAGIIEIIKYDTACVAAGLLLTGL